jgi:hypothetical protein
MNSSLPRGAERLWVACSLLLRCISHDPVSERLVFSTFVRPVLRDVPHGHFLLPPANWSPLALRALAMTSSSL